MGFFDSIFGDDDDEKKRRQQTGQPPNQSGQYQNAAQSADEAAIRRYRYMLKTAPPETIEEAHREAFAALTPEQRQRVLAELGRDLPEAERRAVSQAGDDPAMLARAATRAEVRQPGTMERIFGGGYGGVGGGLMGGFGGTMAGSLLGSIAGTVVGSYIAQQFFSNDSGFAENNFFDSNTNFGEGGTEPNNWNEAGNYPESPVDEFNTGEFGDDSGGGFDSGGDFGGDF